MATAEMEPEVTTEQDEAPAPAEASPDVVPSLSFEKAHYEAIRLKEREVRKLENKHLHAKEVAAQRKKAFERADTALRYLIARGPDAQKPLPFNDDAPAVRTPLTVRLLTDVDSIDYPNLEFESGQEVDVVMFEGEVCIDAGQERFIELSVDEYEVLTWNEPEATEDANTDDPRSAANVEDVFDSAIAKKLIKAGMPTVGDIGAWTTGGKALTDIDGIGPGLAEKMQARLDEFWAE